MDISSIENKIEKAGFYFQHIEEEHYALLEQYTPLGEDWCLEFNCADINDLVEQIVDYAASFDAEEKAIVYIENRGKHGIPESITDLLKDSKWKENVLTELSDSLTGKPHTKKEVTAPIEVSTSLGTLCAEMSGDPNYPGIFLWLRRNDGTEIDLCAVEVPDDTGVNGYLWGNTCSEEWTEKHTWNNKDICERR